MSNKLVKVDSTGLKQAPKRQDSMNTMGLRNGALHEELLSAVPDSTDEAKAIAKANGCSEESLTLFN